MISRSCEPSDRINVNYANWTNKKTAVDQFGPLLKAPNQIETGDRPEAAKIFQFAWFWFVYTNIATSYNKKKRKSIILWT